MANSSRDLRQDELETIWINNHGNGYVEGCTGFGKTRIATNLILNMNKRHPLRTAYVIVPTQTLKDQWSKIISDLGIQNTIVEIINTALKIPRKVDFLILDEVHNYASDKRIEIFDVVKYKFLLGLTATLHRADGKHKRLLKYAKVIGRVTLEEASKEGYVAPFTVYNVPVFITDVERAEITALTKKFNSYFSWFGHDFKLAMGCLSDTTLRESYAKKLNTTAEKVMIMALQFQRNMSERKKWLYNHSKKIRAAKNLIEYLDEKVIAFGETNESADTLSLMLGKRSRPYHTALSSKDQKINIELFKSGVIDTLCTSKKLDEGADIAKVSLGVCYSATSTLKQTVQRLGRAIRKEDGKVAKFVNFYIKDTQDEKWLKARIKGVPNVVWCESEAELYDRLKGVHKEKEVKRKRYALRIS